MKTICLWSLTMLGFAFSVFADTETVLQQIHERQLIIAGQRQGSAELARREIKALMRQYAKEEGKTQLGKALDWLDERGGDFGFESEVTSLYNGFNRYASRDSVVPLEMNFVKSMAIVETVDGHYNTGKDYVDHAKRGYSYAKRLYELSGAFEENQEPAAKRLSSNLSLLADAMSNYGGKIPLVGAIIAGYGDVAGEMVKAVDQLGEKLNARNPWLNDVSYGSSELTRAYRHQLSGVWLKPVLGLRDCYVADDPSDRVFIFDLSSRHRDRATGTEYDGAFVPVSFYPPFDGMSSKQAIRELRRRYMMFDRAGAKTPGVRQVLREAERIVRLEPQLDHAAIQAGQGFTMQVLASYAVNGRPVPRGEDLSFALSQDSGYWGTETQTASLGQFITWTAPTSAGLYEMNVDLSEEAKAGGWRIALGKPAKAPYVVGTPTHLSLLPTVNRLATTRRQAVPVVVELNDGEGGALTSGELVLEVKPRGLFGLVAPGSYLDPTPRLELSGPELRPSFTVQLVPLETGLLEPGMLQLTASFRDGTTRLATATTTLRVQAPRIVDDGHIIVKPRSREGVVDFSITVSDESEQKVRVGSVTITALTDGLFQTHRGSENTTTLELNRPGHVTWIPGPRGSAPLRFRLEFSGGAWEDAIYNPVTTEWVYTGEPLTVETPLFVGAPVPTDPAGVTIPRDPQEAAALGAAVEVTPDEWKAVETATLPEGASPDRPQEPVTGNIFAGLGIPDTPAETPPAGNLFAGVGDGLGVPDAIPVPPAPPAAPSSVGGAVAQFAAEYGIPDSLMRAPDFAEALAEVLEIYHTKPAAERRDLANASRSRHLWWVSLDFENNDPVGRVTKIDVIQRDGPQAYNFSNASTYYKTMSQVGNEWVRMQEHYFDPAGSGIWLRYTRNPNGNKEESCDGSGPKASLVRVWHRNSTQLQREVHYDARTGEETLVQNWDFRGKPAYKKVVASPGNWESWSYCGDCGAISNHSICRNGTEAKQAVEVCTHVAENLRRMRDMF